MTDKTLVKEVFALDVTRNIAPVVYFHEQAPEKVAEEVSEYIITGGYPENDPRHKRIKSGIHEQLVRLLTGIADELHKAGGVELPASWISGFYGSGKSSFAKLLGLALNGVVLPDGRPLDEVWLSRDDSPKAQEFREAWQRLRSQIDPIAVVFDIGAVARDDEHIHAAVKRQLQARLGYCGISNFVADHELRLELDGKWQEFEARAAETLGQPWAEAKYDQLAEEAFSEVMHVMNPSRYLDPMSWFDSRAGSQTGVGSSVAETTKAITDMLSIRAAGKTLFIVVDEVSQYIHQNDSRMLKLQSFVSDLGQKLKGRVWLLATGQQKLEDSEEATSIGKLKDRFPPKLRVHLAPTNIRDVVHKRLLKKAPSKEAELRSLFQTHRPDLKLYGYACDSITEEDFLEVYPMLPGHVDLLMQITSNLRTRSSRVKGDDHAIRGLLQLLGELFREQKLGEQELGELVTLESIYEVQQSNLDADVQNTLVRLFNHEEVINDEMAGRVAKAVALLELIQEQEPTTATLVSQCLYARLGQGNQEPLVTEKLEKLRELGLLSYSEKLGYKIQSSVGQEWQRERDTYSVIPEAISEVIREKLKELLGTVERPKYKGKTFPWIAFYSDGKQQRDERVQGVNDPAVITVDFRYLTVSEDRNPTIWVQNSDRQDLRDRLIWLVGKSSNISGQVRELIRSRKMVEKYESRKHAISRDKQRLLFDEQSRLEGEKGLEKSVRDAIAQAFMEGEMYFRGRSIDFQSFGHSFATVLERVGESLLPDLYRHYTDVAAITPTELTQLLEPTLSGPSQKFMGSGLGILELDAGKYMPTCSGEVPARIGQYIQDQKGISGTALLSHFGSPPYGYPADVVKACLAGLLRAGKLRIRPEAGPEITSVRDPGARDMFTKERDIKRADILPRGDGGITARDKVAICKFFNDFLSVDPPREEDAIADAVFQQFPNQMKQLQALAQRYNRLPNRPELPSALTNLQQALEKCMQSRQVEDTVLAVKKYLDKLRDGLDVLGRTLTDMTDEAVEAVRQAVNLREHQVAQLRQIERLAEVQEAVDALEEQLASERPWLDINSLQPHVQAIAQHYKEVRLSLIERQEKQADEIRERLKQRKGFAQLSEKKGEYVVRPVLDALVNTTPETLYPSLLELKDSALLKLQNAEEKANTYLNNVLSEVTGSQVIELSLGISGREVSTPEEVEALVSQLKERLLAQIKDQTNIRIRLLP